MRTHSPRPRALGQRRFLVKAPFLLALVAAVLCALPASAQDRGISLGLLAGIGGSPDSDSYTDISFQAVGSWEWRINTLAQIRVGGLQLELDREGTLQESDLTFVTVATEYRHSADFYDSGVIIGVGFYRLESDFAFGPGGAFASDEEDSFGLHLGVSGHFNLTDRWSVPIELMGHYADFDHAQFFVTAQVGLFYSF